MPALTTTPRRRGEAATRSRQSCTGAEQNRLVVVTAAVTAGRSQRIAAKSSAPEALSPAAIPPATKPLGPWMISSSFGCCHVFHCCVYPAFFVLVLVLVLIIFNRHRGRDRTRTIKILRQPKIHEFRPAVERIERLAQSPGVSPSQQIRTIEPKLPQIFAAGARSVLRCINSCRASAADTRK